MAAMTTAASAAVGMSFSRPVPRTSKIPRVTAATRPVSWVRAPAASATGVREELLEIGNP